LCCILAVAVVRGRTRSLVERFERREKIQIDEDQSNVFLPTINEINETREKVHNEDQIKASPASPPVTIVCERRERIPLIEDQKNLPSIPKTTIFGTDKSPDTLVKFNLHFTKVLIWCISTELPVCFMVKIMFVI